MKNLSAKIEYHPSRKTPRRIFDFKFLTGNTTPEQATDHILEAVREELEIDNNYSTLVKESIKTSPMGSHRLYQQHFRDLPVSGAWLRLDVDREGSIYQVFSELVPAVQLEKAEQRAKAHDIAVAGGAEHLYTDDEVNGALALEALGMPAGTRVHFFAKEQVYFQVNEIPVRAWKIITSLSEPPIDWRIYLDAYSGQVLKKYIITKFLDGSGKVFDPNPVVVLNDTTLRNNSVIPVNAYKQVVLPGLDGSGTLSGPYVNTGATSGRVTELNLVFDYSRGVNGFTEVMAYFHIDSAQRYIQSLGIDDVLSATSVPVNVSGGPVSYSSYSTVRKDITFGTSAIDGAEDAEIILHEYGHAIQDFMVHCFGNTSESAAMGEGFSDYFAVSFFSDAKPAAMRATFGNWKSVSFSGAEPPCMRRLDSNKLYRDRGGNPYIDCEIWSACLWEIRTGLGREAADKIIILQYRYLSQGPTFVDGANAIIMADTRLNGGQNKDFLTGIFINRGILENPVRNNLIVGAVPDAFKKVVFFD